MANAEPQPSDTSSIFRLVYEDAGSEYLARGSAADVWKIAQPDSVHASLCVLKILRVSPGDFNSSMGTRNGHENQPSDSASTWSWAQFVKTYNDKVSEWVPLTHANVVRVYALEGDLNLRVEYCANGCIRDYLKMHVGQQIRDPPIIHGSLNAGKLFIDAHGRTKIGEFGLTSLCYPVAALVPSVVFTGFSRWMSPELFDLNLDGTDVPPTLASDVWALGCTIFEIIFEKLPYPEYRHDVRIQRAMSEGEPPSHRDIHSFDDNYGYELWPTIQACWSMDPHQRPPVARILEQSAVAQQRVLEDNYADTQRRMTGVDWSQRRLVGVSEGGHVQDLQVQRVTPPSKGFLWFWWLLAWVFSGPMALMRLGPVPMPRTIDIPASGRLMPVVSVPQRSQEYPLGNA